MMEIVTVETGFVWTVGGGGGTGGDADTLQGQDGAYYRSRANHTGTQAPGTIVQDASNRFVTDAEKSAWNAKQDALAFTPVATTDPRLSDARTPTAHTHSISDVTGLTDQLAAKATPAYVDQKITDLIGGAGAAFDTLKELEDELANSGDAVAALTTQVSQKENSANKVANLTAPDDVKFPTTLAVSTALAGKANTSHTHSIAQVTNLQTTLDAKADAAATTSALNTKANTADLATVATTGAFSDLSGKPRYEVLSALPGDLSGYPDGSRIVVTS